MGKTEHGFQDVDYILNLFGGKIPQARRLYLEFVKKGVAAGRRPDLTGGGLVRSAAQNLGIAPASYLPGRHPHLNGMLQPYDAKTNFG